MTSASSLGKCATQEAPSGASSNREHPSSRRELQSARRGGAEEAPRASLASPRAPIATPWASLHAPPRVHRHDERVNRRDLSVATRALGVAPRDSGVAPRDSGVNCQSDGRSGARISASDCATRGSESSLYRAESCARIKACQSSGTRWHGPAMQPFGLRGSPGPQCARRASLGPEARAPSRWIGASRSTKAPQNGHAARRTRRRTARTRTRGTAPASLPSGERVELGRRVGDERLGEGQIVDTQDSSLWTMASFDIAFAMMLFATKMGAGVAAVFTAPYSPTARGAVPP